jgi:4-amino-4-deoxy-L-arabinose transferase-like glycosyltransferase
VTSKSPAFLLPAILAVAFALRLAHFVAVHDQPFFGQLAMDSQEYDRWAQEIANGRWIGSEVFFQAPLYPYVLATVYTIVGHRPDAVYLLQIAIAIFGIFAIHRATRAMADERVALIAAGLAALYGPFLFHDVQLLKESFAVAVTSALLFALAIAGSSRQWLGAGALLGVLALLRENALLLVPFLLPLAWRPVGGFRPFTARASAFVAGMALVLAPVAVRNGLVGGTWLPTTYQGGVNFYIGNNPSADGTYRPIVPGKQIPALERREPARIAEQEVGHSLSPGEVSSFWLHRALRFASQHPGDFARLQLRKLGRFFDWYEQPDAVDYYWVRGLSPVYRLPLVEFSTLSVLAVAGLWLSRRELRRFAPCLLFATGWTATTIAFFIFSRYRLPLVPAILPLAAIPVASAWDAWRDRRRGRVLAASGIVAAFALSFIPYAPRADLVEYNLARLAEERGDEAGAKRHYQAAYDADPRNFLACLNLGNVAVRRGDWPTALRLFREALALEPKSDDVEANLGGALLATGALDEAAAHFEAALRLNPQHRAALYNDAVLLARRGDVAGARALVDRLLALDPQNQPALALRLKLAGG